MKELERIGEFQVHPVASIFPMMGEKESIELGMSISDIGLQEPVVVHEGLLVDGRNRVKACMASGHPIRTVEWSKIVAHNHQRTGKGGIGDFPATTVDQWIMAKNLDRRNLTPDQIAAVWTQHGLWEEEEDARKAKAKAAFEKGKTGNETGRRGKEQARLISDEPVRRDHAAENARTTVGRIAQKAKISRHKAEQAVKLVKAVESGAAPAEDLELVKAGLKKLNEAVKPLRPPKPEPAPMTLEERVKAEFGRFMRRVLAMCTPEEQEQAKQIVKGLL